MTEESFDRLVSVNLTGAFNVCQAVAGAMIAGGRPGRIVVTSSVHVQMPFAEMSVYGATKAGLKGMVETMAIELAPHGITVNHIGPGWVRSFINDASPVPADGGGSALDAEADPGRPAGRPEGDGTGGGLPVLVGR